MISSIWHVIQFVGWTIVIASIAIGLALLQTNYKIWSYQGVRVVSGIVGIWLLIYMMLPEWWSNRWWNNGMYLIPTILIISVGAMLMPTPKKPIEHRIGKIIVFVGSIVLISFIAFESKDGKNIFDEPRRSITTTLKSWWDSTPPPASASARVVNVPSRSPIPSAVVKNTINEIVFSQLPPDEAIALVARAQEESGFRQLNEDGTVFRGQKNPKDVCAFQINEDYWGEKAKSKGFDLSTTEGCANMAVAIYKERGLDAWNTLKGVKDVNTFSEIIVVPVGEILPDGSIKGEISKSIYVPVGSNCHGIPDREVTVWDDQNRPHKMTPTEIPSFFTTTVRYSVKDGPPAKIKYVCR